MRKAFLGLLTVLFMGSLLVATSCGPDGVLDECSGCPPDSPWSVPGISSCYKTRTDCLDAEGAGCEVCS